MLTVKKAIEQRRSVRKFKFNPVPDKCINTLLDAARSAPSSCDSQPWRFKIIKDERTKFNLAKAVHNQRFVADAPIIIICCADLKGYLQSTISGIHRLNHNGIVDDALVKTIIRRNKKREKSWDRKLYGLLVSLNVNLAIENMILRALDFGLGSCYVGALDNQKIRDIFEWDYDIFPVAILLVGYPDESPGIRNIKKIADILI